MPIGARAATGKVAVAALLLGCSSESATQPTPAPASTHAAGSTDQVVEQPSDGSVAERSATAPSASLPDDFPAGIPIPAGMAVGAAQRSVTGDGTVYVVTGELPADWRAATTAYVDALLDAGFGEDTLMETPNGNALHYVGGTHQVGASFAPKDGDTATVVVSLSVSPDPDRQR